MGSASAAHRNRIVDSSKEEDAVHKDMLSASCSPPLNPTHFESGSMKSPMTPQNTDRSPVRSSRGSPTEHMQGISSATASPQVSHCRGQMAEE